MKEAFFRILDWTGSYRKRVYAGVFLSMFQALAIALPTFFAAWILNLMIDDTRGVRELDPSLIGISLAVIAGCILVRFAFSYAKCRIQESVGYERAPEVRLSIGNVLKRVPLGYFSQVKTGDILSTATTDLSLLELEGVRQIDAAVGAYLAAGVIIAWLFSVSPWCGVAALVGIGLVSFTLRGINRASARLAPIAHRDVDRMAGALIGFFRGLGTAKSYGRAGEVVRPLNDSVEKLRATRIAIERAFTPFNVVHKGILDLTSIALVAIAAAGALSGKLDLWAFLAIAFFSTTIFGAIGRITDAAHLLADLDDTVERLARIEHALFIDENGRNERLERFDVEFEDVSFSYREAGGSSARPVLHEMSLRVPEGSTCAIVGPSGSGKTTVTSLMARFYDVDSGCVRIGGRDVRELTCDSLLRNFSMVFQDVYLFNDTIEANIAFGRPDATREMVEEAARLACCDEFVRALPQGYDTVVGEGGSTLSGGERQRISIARALLKDAPIVILDEATASVDPENERLIQQALTELSRGKTVVVIAHRLATVEHADQILVVDGGRIVQRGTHAELLSQEGVYRRFVQARAEAEGWRLGA